MTIDFEILYKNIKSCSLCKLCKDRKNAIPGKGNPSASIFIIGDLPSEADDLDGKPFSGRAGSFIEQLFNSAGIKESELFFTNITKCHTKELPSIRQIKTCIESFLWKQIDLVNPKLIVAFGKRPVEVLFPEFKSLTNVYGKVFLKKDRQFLLLRNPAIALFQQSFEPILKRDFQLIKLFSK